VVPFTKSKHDIYHMQISNTLNVNATHLSADQCWGVCTIQITFTAITNHTNKLPTEQLLDLICSEWTFTEHLQYINRQRWITRSSAIAEGSHDALVSRNLATTKHTIWKWLQSTNDVEVYTPKVITIAAIR